MYFILEAINYYYYQLYGRAIRHDQGLRYQGFSLQYCHGPPMCRLAVPRKRSLDKKRGEDCVGSIV